MLNFNLIYDIVSWRVWY